MTIIKLKYFNFLKFLLCQQTIETVTRPSAQSTNHNLDGHRSTRAKYKPKFGRSPLQARKIQTTPTHSQHPHMHTCTHAHMHPPRVRLPSADSASPSAGGHKENLAEAKVLRAATHVKSCTADVKGPSPRKTHAHKPTLTPTHTIPTHARTNLPRVRLPSDDSASPSAGGRKENLAGAKVLQAATHVKSCTADVRGPSPRKTHAHKPTPTPTHSTHTCTHEPPTSQAAIGRQCKSIGGRPRGEPGRSQGPASGDPRQELHCRRQGTIFTEDSRVHKPTPAHAHTHTQYPPNARTNLSASTKLPFQGASKTMPQICGLL